MAQKGFGGFKWLIIAAVIVAIVGGVWFFNRDDDSAPQYTTAPVTRGDLTQVVTATGTLNPVTNVTVGSQISGIILRLYADWNSEVKANQVVAQLDPATYKASVASAAGDLTNAVANLELQQIQTRRAQALFAEHLISQSDYDTAVATLHQAEAMVQIKQAALDNARVNLDRCTISSPVDGTVISRNVDVGQTVAASMSAPVLFQIANDLTQMQIDANVSEADIGTVDEGQEVSFTVDAFPDRKFVGKVRQIRNSPTTVQNVVTYDAVIDVNNPDKKLRPGMTANASIITAQRTGVLKVPNAALRFRPPEPVTNQTFFARLLGKIGIGAAAKSSPTNSAATTLKTGDTNKTEVAAGGEPPLTGNEPPEELMRRVREMRERGEELPPAIRAKLRELFQSGALQRPGGGGPGGGGPGGGQRPRPSGPASRTIYSMAAASAAGEDASASLQPIRVRTGISDGAYTEITEGLKEGDQVVTSVKMPQADVAAAPGGTSPFGGGGGGFGRGGGGGGGGFRGGR
jgi:HlyD family secretion protein